MVDNVDPSDSVLISINDKLCPFKRPLSKECCIYRVPHNLRKVNEDAYCPWIISIGPFHHGDPKLEPMQEHKLRYWKSFLKRNSPNDPSCYVQLVRDKQQAIRDCYNQKIKLDHDSFVEMVVLDAIFIIEFFMFSGYAGTVFHEVGVVEHICNKDAFRNLILRDLKIEENQLPFFILNDLYNLAFPQLAVKNPFIRHAHRMFEVDKLMPYDVMAEAKVKHFVDLLRLSYVWSLEEKSDSSDDDSNEDQRSGAIFSPSVTELHEAGVRFRVSTSHNLFHISFQNGVLTIPRLWLQDYTETIFRNIMAFEQLHDEYSNLYMADYCSFLDSLINTTKDVDILVEKGIIVNWLGSSEEAKKLMNNIFTNIIIRHDNFYFSDVCQKLTKYKSRRWPKYRAALRHNYFNHPWAIISVVYALVLLILTVLQVITGFTN